MGQQLLTFFIQHFNEIWAPLRLLIINLFGILLVTSITSKIISEKSWKMIVENLKIVGMTAKKNAPVAFEVLAKSITDPIKYPRIEIVALLLASVSLYVTSIIFGLLLLVVLLFFAEGHIKSGLEYQIGAILLSLFFIYFTLFFKAQGGRTLEELHGKIDKFKKK